MAHFYIAAAHKSSGKTSISIGLVSAIAKRGLAVQPFKKGPDYIDPLWLSRAAGQGCYNLDFFTMSHAEIHRTFALGSAGADISLIEGNKGLYDGLAVDGSDSNAALAKHLTAPVVLVIDTSGMTRGIAPLISGYLDFDSETKICGVVLNKVGGTRHEGKLRAALERYTDIEVLGAVGRDRALEIPERHLGLVPANEDAGADTMIERLADAVSSGINIDRLMAHAGTARSPDLQLESESVADKSTADVRIAIARDAAFGFYYRDDLEAFAAAGAELVPFDTLKDSQLPDVDGLFIGGGFPETHLFALAGNKDLLASMRQALASGMPAYAECGGLMYLAQSIRWHGEKLDMVGAIPADVVVENRPQGRGYVVLQKSAEQAWPTVTSAQGGPNTTIPAHEFHYAKLENLPDDLNYAFRVKRGTGIDGQHDGLMIDNLLAGFAHHRNTASNPWVGQFVDFVREKSRYN